ncbi:HD domain-containing protein [Chitinophaga sp. YIM B06452]|uniref:HD domain-containing protein n=1 Tax=Chitinophaga sp. YIM B06452 TaxID=3082158 RepID=UPI0031FEE2FA
MEHPEQLIEMLLQRYRDALGRDYDRYKHHVYRVFYNCLLLDDENTHAMKYAIAAAFHDIGIWTDHTFDYLHPSIKQVKQYLREAGRTEITEEIAAMISWHHKISPYKGVYENSVEIFRKADWIDVSLGALSFGANRESINENRRKFPNRGFHWFLVRQTVKNFFRHPLNPVPVFRK